jgi:D-beta-D-heptose 7-phosphate kinase/D-beta-D-heptose 1-phosphate adenosyltransferase
MEDIFEKFKDLKVLVVGDVMLDKYYFTDVERISPEGPVPVAKYKYEKLTLGGGANVALNFANLGVEIKLIGKISIDEEGSKLQSLLKESNIEFIPILSKDKTITKTRIISGSNQLLRLDFEEKSKNTVEIEEIIKKEIKKAVEGVDIIIISDYNKGFINDNIVEYISSFNKYIAVDSKPGNLKKIHKINLLKPNFKEAKEFAKFLGDNENYSNTDLDVEELGTFLKEKLNTNILITRSGAGVSYFEDNLILHEKIQKSEVFDVTGAGDTSIAIFSLLNYLEYDRGKSLKIMNAAAKITVSHLGIYAPKVFEIKEVLEEKSSTIITSQEKLLHIIDKLKSEKKRIVFTNGCFDLIHKGHIETLNKAKSFGDILILGLNSDSSVKRLKGEARPIIDENSRAYLTSHLKPVDYVVIFDEDTPIELIKLIKPNVHVKGGDYNKDKIPETKIVEENGGRVEIINFVDNFSTTNIIGKIKNEKD